MPRVPIARGVLRAIALVPLLMLAGCASVPLSTMWTMRNFDIAAIDPDALRMATAMEPDALRIDPTKAMLELRLTPRAGGEDEVHALALRDAAVATDGLVPDDGRHWQVFRLTPESAAALHADKPRFGEDIKANYSGAAFSVKFGFVDGAPMAGLDELRASVRLALATDQTPFTLLDRARIPVTDSATSADSAVTDGSSR